jgi:hypothetical protein
MIAQVRKVRFISADSASQAFRQPHPVVARHLDVAHGDASRPFRHSLERLVRVGRLTDLMAKPLGPTGHHLPHGGLIVDDKN